MSLWTAAVYSAVYLPQGNIAEENQHVPVPFRNAIFKCYMIEQHKVYPTYFCACVCTKITGVDLCR